MPIKYEYNKRENIVSTIVSGTHTCIEVLEHFAALIDDTHVQKHFVDIVDYRAVDGFNFSSSEAAVISSLHRRLEAKKRVRAVIFIVDNELQHARANMMRMMHENQGADCDVKIVKNEDECLEALKQL